MYPTDGEFDSDLYASLTLLPNGGTIDVPWLQKHVWSETVDFSIPKDKLIKGMHANMFFLVMKDQKDRSKNVIVKRVIPRELPPKSSPEMWRDIVKSVQREIDFYNKILPGLKDPDVDQIFPKCYYCEQRTSDSPMDAYLLLFLEDVSDFYFQKCSMNEVEMKKILAGLAKFHSMFWGKGEEIIGRERGGFWPLDRRPSQEILNASNTWSALLERLPNMKDLVPDCEHLIDKVAANAQAVDTFVSEHCWTRIHGDAKGWNLFLPNDLQMRDALFIDLAWTGKGHPYQDVAVVLTTTSESSLLEKMDELVDFYTICLKKELSTHGVDHIVDNLRTHFDVTWLDYARVIVTGLWKRLSPEQMDKYQNLVGPSMITKSWPHIKFIVQRIHQKIVVEKVVDCIGK